LSWPPPLAARWTALGLFMFALTLHVFLALGGAIAGLDFKLLIILDELAAILLAPVLFALLLGVSFQQAFFLRKAHWGHYALAVAAAIPLQIMGGAMQEIVLELIPGGDAWRELLESALEPLLSGNTTADLLVLVFGAVVLAAVCEEILFRGLMMRLLARGGRWWLAISVSAILFAVFHLDFIGLLPRTVLGMYFGVLVWRSGSIFPAMLAHALNNLLAFGLAPLADPEAASPTLLQATLLATGAGVLFLAMMTFYMRRTAPRAAIADAEDTPVASAAPEPTDISTPPDSSRHTDPRES
jgi:membrane protease YdiL (CAAX protease family)